MIRPSLTWLWIGVLACGLAIAGCKSEAAPAAAAGGSTVDQVCDVAAKLFHIDRSEVRPTSSLAELDRDDLDCVELILELEDRFNVSIDDAVYESASNDEITMSKLAAAVDRAK
jgi:acyl carrier protein